MPGERTFAASSLFFCAAASASGSRSGTLSSPLSASALSPTLVPSASLNCVIGDSSSSPTSARASVDSSTASDAATAAAACPAARPGETEATTAARGDGGERTERAPPCTPAGSSSAPALAHTALKIAIFIDDAVNLARDLIYCFNPGIGSFSDLMSHYWPEFSGHGGVLGRLAFAARAAGMRVHRGRPSAFLCAACCFWRMLGEYRAESCRGFRCLEDQLGDDGLGSHDVVTRELHLRRDVSVNRRGNRRDLSGAYLGDLPHLFGAIVWAHDVGALVRVRQTECVANLVECDGEHVEDRRL